MKKFSLVLCLFLASILSANAVTGVPNPPYAVGTVLVNHGV